MVIDTLPPDAEALLLTLGDATLIGERVAGRPMAFEATLKGEVITLALLSAPGAGLLGAAKRLLDNASATPFPLQFERYVPTIHLELAPEAGPPGPLLAHSPLHEPPVAVRSGAFLAHHRAALLAFEELPSARAALAFQRLRFTLSEGGRGAYTELILPRLRRHLAAQYDLDELRTLCFDLRLDFDELPAQRKSGKARELLLACQRKGQLGSLLVALRQQRPNSAW